MRMFSDASEARIERSNELRDLPEEIVDDDGLNDLPDEIGLEDVRQEPTLRLSLAEEGLQSGENDGNSNGERSSDCWGENKDSEEQGDERDDNLGGEDVRNLKNDATDDVKDTKELTNEEINALQQRAIKEAFGRIVRGEQMTDAEKGNLGEMLMDQYYISQGYTPIHLPRVIDLEHKSGQGIDGAYERTKADGSKEYVIADAKVNSSKLNKGLADGTDQMSDTWIEKRLDNSVGKEKADEIRDAYEDDPESVSKTVYHFSYGDTDDGISSSDISTVDSAGNQNKDKLMVQVFDRYGNETSGGKDDER